MGRISRFVILFLSLSLCVFGEEKKDFNRWRFYGLLAVGDVVTSEYAWAGGAKEGNPIMVHGRAVAYVSKAAFTVGMVKVDEYFSRHYSVSVRRAFRVFVGAWYGFWMGKAIYHGADARR